MSFALSNVVDTSKVFVINRSQLELRWDPNYYRGMRIFRQRINKGAFPIERLNRSLALVQYGISERATEEPVGVPMLRMINLQADTWDLSSMKYIRMTEEEKKKYLLEQGDLLFNRTNSKELVGKCNVFNLPGEYVFASYLIRVRVKNGTLQPDYVSAFLASSLGRIQIDAVSRQIAGMTNINAEEIRDLYIPALDESVQGKVVTAWQAAIRKRDQNMDKARVIFASIDDVLLSELGISRKPEQPNTIGNRIFQTVFSTMAGQRWDPLYHQGDMFDFVRNVNCDLPILGKLAEYILTGFAAGRGDQGDSATGIIQIRPTNLSEERELVFRRNVYIDPSELNAHKADLLKKGEVLFNNTNSQEQVGKSVYFDLDGHYFSSNHITRIFPRHDRLNPQYLAYVLNLYQRQKVFFKLCTNWNNQSGVGNDVLHRIPIPLPRATAKKDTLTRQAEVVACLDKIRDQARELRRHAGADLEKTKQEIEALILGMKAMR